MSANARRRLYGIITVGGALVAGVWWASFSTDAAAPPHVGAAASEAPVGPAPDARGPGGETMDALRQEVARLRDEVAVVQRRVDQLARRADEAKRPEVARGAAVPEGRLPGEPRLSLARLEAERQRREAEHENLILAQAEANEAAFQQETTETTWSGEAREVIARAVAAEELAGTSVQEVECRATLCRVEVTHIDQHARSVFARQFLVAVAPLLPQAMMQAVETKDGSVSTVLYLARDGHDFPQLEGTR
jgi:hypothetical protein